MVLRSARRLRPARGSGSRANGIDAYGFVGGSKACFTYLSCNAANAFR
jgi:hypothetical protein